MPCWSLLFLVMSGTYGRCQSPLKSGLPSAVRGAGPVGVFGPRAVTGVPVPWAATGMNDKDITANTVAVAAIQLTKRVLTLDSPVLLLPGYCCCCVPGRAPGPPSSADPENNFFPSTVTARELQVLLASLAPKPSMVTSLPTFREFLLQPCLVSEFGGPPSHCHFDTEPFSSFASR